MKARVKETGELVEVHTCDDADFQDRKGNYYWEHQLYFGTLDDFDNDEPDYWTRLEHQYAGMAMQAILLFYGNAKVDDDYCAEEAKYYAHTLVEKLKEK
jgi:hypothetical protein